MMTKGDKVSEECFLRRRVFVMATKGKHRSKEGLPYDVLIIARKKHS